MGHDDRFKDAPGRQLHAGPPRPGIERDQQFIEACRIVGVEASGKDRLTHDLGCRRGSGPQWQQQKKAHNPKGP